MALTPPGAPTLSPHSACFGTAPADRSDSGPPRPDEDIKLDKCKKHTKYIAIRYIYTYITHWMLAFPATVANKGYRDPLL